MRVCVWVQNLSDSSTLPEVNSQAKKNVAFRRGYGGVVVKEEDEILAKTFVDAMLREKRKS